MLKSILAASALFAAFAQAPLFAGAQAVPGPSPSPSAQSTPAPSPSPTASASPTPVPTTTPMPVPSVSAPPVATPLPPAPTPWPTTTPVTLPSPVPTVPPPVPTPTPTPAGLPTPLMLPPDAAPQILAVQVSDPVFHSGELVSGTVITSTNVAAVEIRLGKQAIRMQRTDFGVWQLSYKMPHVPFFYRRTFTAQVVAMNTAGATAERDLQVSVR